MQDLLSVSLTHNVVECLAQLLLRLDDAAALILDAPVVATTGKLLIGQVARCNLPVPPSTKIRWLASEDCVLGGPGKVWER